MKKLYLINPGAASAVRIRRDLIGSRLGCVELEDGIAEDIQKVAKKAILDGVECDLTEIFSRSLYRHEDRNCLEIYVPNEILVEELMDRVFDVVDETDEHIYLMVKPD